MWRNLVPFSAFNVQTTRCNDETSRKLRRKHGLIFMKFFAMRVGGVRSTHPSDLLFGC
jgi:hypothetical protein